MLEKNLGEIIQFTNKIIIYGRGELFFTDKEIKQFLSSMGIPLQKSHTISDDVNCGYINGYSVKIKSPYPFNADKANQLLNDNKFKNLAVFAYVADIICNKNSAEIPQELTNNPFIKRATQCRAEQIESIRKDLFESDRGSKRIDSPHKFYPAVWHPFQSECEKLGIKMEKTNYTAKGGELVDFVVVNYLEISRFPLEGIKKELKIITPDLITHLQSIKIKRIKTFFDTLIKKLAEHNAKPISINYKPLFPGKEPSYENINVFIEEPNPAIRSQVLETLEKIGLMPKNPETPIMQLTNPDNPRESLCNQALVFTNLCNKKFDLDLMKEKIASAIQSLESETKQQASSSHHGSFSDGTKTTSSRTFAPSFLK